MKKFEIVSQIHKHYSPVDIPSKSLEDAVETCLHFLKEGNGWPVKIIVNGETVWERSDPTGIEESLRSLLAEEKQEITGEEAKIHLRKILEIIVADDYPDNLMYHVCNYLEYHNLMKSGVEVTESRMQEIEDHIGRITPEGKAGINI